MLTEAHECFGRHGWTVLMDRWYAHGQWLNTIAGAGGTVVVGLRSRRIVCVRGRKPSVRPLAKSCRSAETVRMGRRRFRVSRHEVWLPRVGPVVVLLSRGGRRRAGS
jgi:hypothetical protein